MKKLVILTVLAGVAIQIARKNNIKSFEDVKNMILPLFGVKLAKA